MKRVRAVVIGVSVIVLLVASAFVLRDRPGAVGFEGDLRAGGTLEALQLPELVGDGAADYADYADRPLVINFFASWCPNCIAEMPDFELVHRRFADRVSFLGISQRDARDASVALVERTGVTYDTAIDEQGSFFRALGGLGMPTTVFIRPGGQIADIWVGGMNAEVLEQLILEHFDVA